jgi:DNA-directed RNA polymerase subunit N (RpoN/RPB10)
MVVMVIQYRRDRLRVVVVIYRDWQQYNLQYRHDRLRVVVVIYRHILDLVDDCGVQVHSCRRMLGHSMILIVLVSNWWYWYYWCSCGYKKISLCASSRDNIFFHLVRGCWFGGRVWDLTSSNQLLDKGKCWASVFAYTHALSRSWLAWWTFSICISHLFWFIVFWVFTFSLREFFVLHIRTSIFIFPYWKWHMNFYECSCINARCVVKLNYHFSLLNSATNLSNQQVMGLFFV